MHAPPSPPVLYAFASTETLSDALANFIVAAQTDAIQKKGRFTVALSGGSLPQLLSALIGRQDVRWDKWYAILACTRTLADPHTGGSFTPTSVSSRSTTPIQTTISVRRSCLPRSPSPLRTSTPSTPQSSEISRNSQMRTRRCSSKILQQRTRLASPFLTSSSWVSVQTDTPVPFSQTTNSSRKVAHGWPISRTLPSHLQSASPLPFPSLITLPALPSSPPVRARQTSSPSSWTSQRNPNFPHRSSGLPIPARCIGSSMTPLQQR